MQMKHDVTRHCVEKAVAETWSRQGEEVENEELKYGHFYTLLGAMRLSDIRDGFLEELRVGTGIIGLSKAFLFMR
ncbi:hypothetical protein PHJA_002094600 [Phtheirospermum japonicum]|uniref:Uncharacterized protein n=1 Tax=Phtheirospermum japonicum TaxID=374723 RepID=A0A830CWV6_9LAMI|nr:hypothetical protein PHJA_002094600 [Phtheirospermum japonicum]